MPEKIPGKLRPSPTQGALSATGLHFGIVVSRFNSFITERLLAGALDALQRAGAKETQIEVVRVPGSFEIPIAAKKLGKSDRCDAIICIGCVIRGETSHFEHVCAEAARGVQIAQLDTGVPMAFCVLTCETLEQAIDRAGLKSGNKGFDAGLAAIEMANLLPKLASNAIEKSREPRKSSPRKSNARTRRDGARHGR
ncbi:MAG: 6,7-dimethyl-8-ribityllumazine synthase [Candidatus Acidiferrales bacterium]|jgi:6,7-dimethyl-8-ribityllumazine synthase|nr:6,7-dimethyl-8-ribityllumazine synthase [Candidatus Acidoferrales bacterium]